MSENKFPFAELDGEVYIGWPDERRGPRSFAFGLDADEQCDKFNGHNGAFRAEVVKRTVYVDGIGPPSELRYLVKLTPGFVVKLTPGFVLPDDCPHEKRASTGECQWCGHTECCVGAPSTHVGSEMSTPEGKSCLPRPGARVPLEFPPLPVPPVTIAHCMPFYDSWEYLSATSVGDFHMDVATGATWWPRHWRFRFIPGKGQPVDMIRNGLVKTALTDYGHHETHVRTGAPADVVLFQDSDVSVPHAPHYARLVDTLLESPHNVGVVGAPVLVQSVSGKPTVNVSMRGMGTKPSEREPFECAGIGFGLVAIRASVFAAMAFPWFKFEYVPVPAGAAPDPQMVKMGLQFARIGEDMGFTDRARRLGFRILCDPRVHATHQFRRAFALDGSSSTWLDASSAPMAPG